MNKCRAFINRFIRDINPLLVCQKVLKTKGLNQDTYQECQQLIQTIPPRAAVRIGFTNWMEKQFQLALALGLSKIGMPISSDIIESLFGIAKQHGTSEIKDANRIALRIPALCGKLTRDDAQNVLKICVKEQEEMVGSIPSLIKQRREVLPNPGSLDKIIANHNQANLTLIPGVKNQGKKHDKNIYFNKL